MNSNLAVFYKSGRRDWATPRGIFRELDYRFHFDLDACATAETAKCESYFTEEDDALKQDWSRFRSIFVNPPYGDQINSWLMKAYLTSEQGSTVVCLVPSRTDTSWWHDICMKGKIEFIRGRIRFDGGKGRAPFPSAIVIFKGKQSTHGGVK